MALPTRVNRGQAHDPFEVAQREFDTMLGRWIGNRGGEASAGLAPYGVDVREDENHLYVEAELPGFRKEEVDITLENQTLAITAQRSSDNRAGNGNSQGNGNGGQPTQAPATAPQGDWLLRERRYTRFQRSFTLPPTVNEQSVNARLQDGVLLITLDKREETKPRKITVG